MTTPATPAGSPAAAPPAPAPSPTESGVRVMPPEASARDIGDLPMEEFASALGIPRDEPEGTPPVEPEGEPERVPVEEAPLDGGELVEGDLVEGEPVDTGAQQTEPTAEAEPRQLAAQFAIYDPQGELEIPELFVSFKGNNKDYEKVPLDKVVRLAQMGVYQHDREQQLTQREQQAQQVAVVNQQLAAKVQQLEGYYDRVFRDPSFYEEAQQLYLRQHTPEQRAARAEASERHAREQLQRTHEERFAATFVRDHLSPALAQLVQTNPLVSNQEVFGQFSYLTAPLLDRGRVPAGRLNVVAQLVQSELVPWVERLQATRAAEQQAQVTQVEQAKQQATLAKRHLARRVGSPPGSPPGAASDKPREFESVHDWLSADMGGALRPESGGGR